MSRVLRVEHTFSSPSPPCIVSALLILLAIGHLPLQQHSFHGPVGLVFMLCFVSFFVGQQRDPDGGRVTFR